MATACSSQHSSPAEQCGLSLSADITSDSLQHSQSQSPDSVTSKIQATNERQPQASCYSPLQPNNEPLDYLPLLGPKTKARDVVLEPLRFPDAPKLDLSCFLDPKKDLPILCMVCDETFGVVSRLGNDGDSTQLSVSVERETKDEGEKEIKKSNLSPKDEWLRHLLLKHNLVVHNVCDICSLKRYVNIIINCKTIDSRVSYTNVSFCKCRYSEYWKARFSKSPISQFAPVIRTNTRSDGNIITIYSTQEKNITDLCYIFCFSKQNLQKTITC